MRLRHLYLALSILGILLPYSQFVPWALAHGLNISLFTHDLFANGISSFFGADVIVSAVALFVFVHAEVRRLSLSKSNLWLPIISVFVVGVSLGLPLFLYFRQKHLDRVVA